MQSTKKVVNKKIKTQENPTEDKLKLSEEKLKKSTYNVTTPRDYAVQRSSAADIYSQRRNSTVQKTPRKVPGTSKDYKASPMKDLLKSSPSSISQISNSSRLSTSSRISSSSKSTVKLNQSNVKARTGKDLPYTNVTVNSPVAKKKLDLDYNAKLKVSKPKEKTNELVKSKDTAKDVEKRNKNTNNKKEVEHDRGDFERNRTKTRTLAENEVKQLTPDKIDNNEEMMNLKKKLEAKPKAFYVDLDGDTAKVETEKASEEEISYEDDFESYESDFDSYHSDKSNDNTSEDMERDVIKHDEDDKRKEHDSLDTKDSKDEENMLDSGSFDLREQRSAKSKPAAMEFISEGSDEDKVTSLDEGFQEGSSAVSSMKTVHVDVLDRLIHENIKKSRPLFMDFKKSKQNKLKKRLHEQMMQRAKDILSMVTLHEMSFTLFDMKPISYDLYMATFGRTNYMQVAVQTFDDGISEEVQTDEVAMDGKWTQFPVKFSKCDVYLNDAVAQRNNRKNNREDYLSKFAFILDNDSSHKEGDVNTLKAYKDNPLRIFLEQRDGAGSCKMLPYDIFKDKMNSDFSVNKLSKFLKKVENKVSRALNSNIKGSVLGNVVISALPFSSGYVNITTKNISDAQSFVKQAKIVNLIVSENKNNLILTVHKKATSGVVAGKSLLCLWDVSIARTEPLKILVAIDNVVIGRYRGSTEGIIVAALEDGSMHLWDLSEMPLWRNDVTSFNKELVEVKTDVMTQTERDREWNLKNRNAGYEQLPISFALQACAYTSSAANLDSKEATGRVVGLEFVGDAQTHDGGRRVVGQLCSLQRLGVLTIWTIVQEKTKTYDIGKAFWSKMKLEKTQTVSLNDHISAREIMSDKNSLFNLNAGKKRMLNRKQERTLAKNFSRPNSTDSINDKSFSRSKSSDSRPASAASARKLPEKNMPHDWESGIVCDDLKIMQYNNTDRYLVAKNNGEVLSCTKSLGVFKVERLCVSSDTSPITCLEVSPDGSPYFLAATDSGTVHLYSVVEARVLLTLDCRNGCPVAETPRQPQADSKGRFVSDPPRRHSHERKETDITAKMSVSSVVWSRLNPCCIFTVTREGALGAWELTHSDIYPKYSGGRAAVACMANDGTLALLTADGDVQVHRISHSQKTTDYLNLFHKYVALL